MSDRAGTGSFKSPRDWRTGRWYWVSLLATFGLALPVVLLHACRRLHNPVLASWAVVSVGFVALQFSALSGNPGPGQQNLSWWNHIAPWLMFGLWAASLVVARGVRERAYPAALRPALSLRNLAETALHTWQDSQTWWTDMRRQMGRPTVAPTPPVMTEPIASLNEDPHVVAARQQRERRRATRALINNDPLLATELGVGRRGAAGSYDDGGLLDLNAAETDDLVAVLALSPENAATLVRLRENFHGFTALSEVSTCLTLTSYQQERLGEYATLLPYAP